MTRPVETFNPIGHSKSQIRFLRFVILSVRSDLMSDQIYCFFTGCISIENSYFSIVISELEQFIFSGLEGDYLISPSVSVTVIEYRPFFIDGEVNSSGGYPYQPGLSVDKAAALAGGYTERASKTKIVIIRDISGVQTTLSAQSSDTVLPGDVITIQQTFF